LNFLRLAVGGKCTLFDKACRLVFEHARRLAPLVGRFLVCAKVDKKISHLVEVVALKVVEADVKRHTAVLLARLVDVEFEVAQKVAHAFDTALLDKPVEEHVLFWPNRKVLTLTNSCREKSTKCTDVIFTLLASFADGEVDLSSLTVDAVLLRVWARVRARIKTGVSFVIAGVLLCVARGHVLLRGDHV